MFFSKKIELCLLGLITVFLTFQIKSNTCCTRSKLNQYIFQNLEERSTLNLPNDQINLGLDKRTIQKDTETLSNILKQGELLTQMEIWNGKILLVKVNETEPNTEFIYYYYNSIFLDKNNNQIQDEEDAGFFNPASTLKVGIAALVLEKLKIVDLAKETEYRSMKNKVWYRIDEDIQKALVISDNEATNRLILFLGFDRLNNKMREKGFAHFSVNRLMLNKGTLIESPAFELRTQDRIIQQPKQSTSVQVACFETKKILGNCSTANDLVEILIRIIQPESYQKSEIFDLRESDRIWLQEIMSKTPKQIGFNYTDEYCRFLHPISKKIIGESGKMLSKCGIGLFSHTYLDTSFIQTKNLQKYYIVFVVTPPRTVQKNEIIQFMNKVVNHILTRL